MRALRACAVAGAVWGAWATGFLRYQAVTVGIASFAGYTIAVTALLGTAYVALGWLRPDDHALRGKWPAITAVALLAVWFAGAVLPAWPPASVVLLPLLALALVGLRRHEARVSGPDLVAAGGMGIAPAQVLPLILLPAAAVVTHEALDGVPAGMTMQLVPLFWVVLTTGGAALLVRSLLMGGRRRPRPGMADAHVAMPHRSP